MHPPKPVHACANLLAAATVFAGACATQAGPNFGDAAADSSVESALELAPPSAGFQVETRGVMIDPGDDVRFCEVVRLPGRPEEIYYVDRIEAALAPGARDLIVSAAPLGSESEALMEVGSRLPCTRAGEAFADDLVEVTSTHQPMHDERYPVGVGHVFHGGQKLAVDYLYANAGDEALPAKVKLNFHSTDLPIAQVAHTARFDNLTIYTPPRGRSSHLAECSFNQDVFVGELVRRTQQRGTTFAVWIVGGERDGELLWYSARPDEAALELPEPIRLTAGEGFRFQCDYRNTSDRELRFGVNASDETCTLGALFWPADERSEAASQDCLLFEVDPDGVARN
jgi:hypothetical protein